MVGIYDKGLTDSTFIQDVSECLEQQTTVCTELNELRNCEIAIVHVTGEHWNTLINDYSCPNSVRVRVSTAGFLDLSKPAKNDNGVYILYLRHPIGDLTVAEWKRKLSGLSNSYIVKALVRGENPNGLKRFFVHEVQGQLSALTILCEGYLAVHAETEDNDINSALELMKWTEFRESERGQKVIQSDLNKKMNAVQQPEWWLNVFEQESFREDVKKEWKDTTSKEEIPPALNDLLKAICSGESVVPPTIVADAYCVLQNRKFSASEWQIRRRKFNHDWLKNIFLNDFDAFIVQLSKSVPDLGRVSEFLEEDFPAWKSQRQEGQWLVQSFESSMSPLQLFNSSLLNRCNDETREWLGYLLHGLWLSRYDVREKAKESQDALMEVNETYEILASELEQSMPIGLTKLISLRPQFCELKVKYKVLFKTLSNLPRYT
ncbi:MAG: hypothetical protein OXH00_05860 [Candidatus Poribacteria bacterium]|nr:hypothetical protein [Candidatus Poribacteria bacterium]